MQPQFKKILYATDMSESSRLALQYALSLAEKYGASITIVHVLRDLPGYVEAMSGANFDQKKLIADSKAKLTQDVSAFCEEETCRLDSGAEMVDQVIVDHGEPGWRILDMADQIGADLIVMGQHGRSALTDMMLMGGTARKVVNNSKVPVLTVRLPAA